jgi:hypothetical protein
VTYSLATAIQFPSGLKATSRIGSVALSRISSNLLPSSVYLLTVPSSDPVMKKPFYVCISTPSSEQEFLAYTSYNGCIVFLTVVHCDGFIVGPGAEYATIVVDSGGYEFLSVRCVGKIGCARSIYSPC